MLSLQAVSLDLFGCDLGIHLISVGKVVSQCRMDLGQGKMRYLCGDFFRRVAQLVPYRNAADGTPVPAIRRRPSQMPGLA